MDKEALVIKDTDIKLDKLRIAPFRNFETNDPLRPRINVGSWKSDKDRLQVFYNFSFKNAIGCN